MKAIADLSHVEHWLFDLDNTLYPAECEVMGLVEKAMTAFVMRETGLPHDQARELQHRYWREHGTTLAGLMAHHGVDPQAFVDEVHEVSLECLSHDAVLRAGLERLPGRRIVFTNGGARHAERVLEALGVADLFDAAFHIEAAAFIPKPDPRTYQSMVAAMGVDARAAAFFEDSERNLEPAAALGMTTVLVGEKARTSVADFVHWRTETLPPFLGALLTKEAE